MKTAWSVLNMFPELTPALKALRMLREHTEDICLDAALRALRYSHMTARAASINSMKSGKSFSQERQDPVKESLPLKHP